MLSFKTVSYTLELALYQVQIHQAKSAVSHRTNSKVSHADVATTTELFHFKAGFSQIYTMQTALCESFIEMLLLPVGFHRNADLTVWLKKMRVRVLSVYMRVLSPFLLSENSAALEITSTSTCSPPLS